MMDARLQGETTGSSGFPVWDLFVDTDQMITPMLADQQEADQQASVAAAILLGGIPQAPQIGVDWLGFMAGTVTFLAVDAQIRGVLTLSGHSDYYPTYTLINGLLGVKPVQSKVT